MTWTLINTLSDLKSSQANKWTIQEKLMVILKLKNIKTLKFAWIRGGTPVPSVNRFVEPVGFWNWFMEPVRIWNRFMESVCFLNRSYIKPKNSIHITGLINRFTNRTGSIIRFQIRTGSTNRFTNRTDIPFNRFRTGFIEPLSHP
ncbi:hypothetical protein BpHYR1_039931 [Brachionus plicatilis]|uniref:Uncharacterized protein n=1 Tax=Brachionus plicatilis TaxID=10195 RepID=A0A3M7PR96_BRAPC|nr:hypothetical protein BpHYR1_039931 [Brachionus plicatilis]